MMTPAQFAFALTCWFLAEKAQLTGSSSVHQVSGFITADVGDNVTLQCLYEVTGSAWLYWYIQTLGQSPRRISEFYVYDSKFTLHNEFGNNPRFTLDVKNRSHHLKISDLKLSDSAMYYCAISYRAILTFAEGFTVRVRGSGFGTQALVHQPESASIQSGGSVTLSCMVLTGTCDGEHSVYWFRNSGESRPELIYSNGGRNGQCERNPHSQTHTCVYHLLIKDPNKSDAGTYHCAVASCGHILFGNGTKLDFMHDQHEGLHVWSAGLAFTSILNVLLAFSICMMNKPSSCKPSESEAAASALLPADGKGYRHGNLTNRSRRQRDPTWSECFYSNIKL